MGETMIPALVLACMLQAPAASESSTHLFLRYLARHQQADGSWGARPAGCACPDETKATPACDAARVAPLLAALSDEDPERRDAAEKELRALGDAALPHLRAASQDPDPEVRGRCAVLARRPDLEARGGGDAELTGLALLTFLGAGFSHLSKDEYDGRCFGTVVKRGLQWLLARQKESGAFDPEDTTGDAIATLALSEAFGMTASLPLQEPTQLGVDRLVATSPDSARGLFWKGVALKSAELSEIPFPKAAFDSLEAIRSKTGDLAVAGTAALSVLVHKTKADPGLADLHALDPATVEIETLYVGSLAMYQFDTPRGPSWRDWNVRVKARLVPLQRSKKGECELGSWDGSNFRARLRTTALNGLDFEFYYR
jgi:hypothetical protein